MNKNPVKVLLRQTVSEEESSVSWSFYSVMKEADRSPVAHILQLMDPGGSGFVSFLIKNTTQTVKRSESPAKTSLTSQPRDRTSARSRLVAAARLGRKHGESRSEA